jgi:hypothetical protein
MLARSRVRLAASGGPAARLRAALLMEVLAELEEVLPAGGGAPLAGYCAPGRLLLLQEMLAEERAESAGQARGACGAEAAEVARREAAELESEAAELRTRATLAGLAGFIYEGSLAADAVAAATAGWARQAGRWPPPAVPEEEEFASEACCAAAAGLAAAARPLLAQLVAAALQQAPNGGDGEHAAEGAGLRLGCAECTALALEDVVFAPAAPVCGIWCAPGQALPRPQLLTSATGC